ncbi:MAG: WG repeat-containing protein, partial [Psychrobacter sp.]
MEVIGLCTLLAFLINCTEAEASNNHLPLETSSTITDGSSAFTGDRARDADLNLPITYYKSVEDHDDTCGFKDHTGRIITPAIYDHCGEFYDGMAYVTHGYDTVGYVNMQGEVAISVIHPIFFDFVPDIRNFSEGLVATFKGDKWGYMDKQGNLVIPYLYNHAGDFSNALATVLKDGKFGAIDYNGDTVIDFRYENLGNFKEGLATFRLTDGDKVGFIDTKGKTVILPIWDAALSFSEGLSAIGVGENDSLKWGFIDSTGKVIIEPQYDEVQPDVGDVFLYTDN